MVFDSPVINDSLTSTIPSSITLSTTICDPKVRCKISSKTISSTKTLVSSPSLITLGLMLDKRDSLSMVFFDITSWTILIVVLAIITPRNKQFFIE